MPHAQRRPLDAAGRNPALPPALARGRAHMQDPLRRRCVGGSIRCRGRGVAFAVSGPPGVLGAQRTPFSNAVLPLLGMAADPAEQAPGLPSAVPRGGRGDRGAGRPTSGRGRRPGLPPSVRARARVHPGEGRGRGEPDPPGGGARRRGGQAPSARPWGQGAGDAAAGSTSTFAVARRRRRLTRSQVAPLLYWLRTVPPSTASNGVGRSPTTARGSSSGIQW